jgi:putative ATP-dependent endonuclease of OLD family
MRLRTLTIKNFRGIRNATLDLRAPFIALIGPGDSTKTTILDALGLVLTPRYNITFTDADFHNADTSTAIIIEAVVVDLPDKLVEERTHGKNRSGIRPDNTLTHDPLDEDGIEECLIVRLTVADDLEPVWEVVRPGDDTGDRMTASERAELGYFRVGESSGQNLRWGRGSALTALTQSQSGATHALVEAQRQARDAIRDLSGTALHKAASLVSDESKKLGAAYADLRPGLDPAYGAGSSSLLLHDGVIPLTQFGLGSRRLLSLAIQENALKGQSIVSIDEVETGLDPHRLANLMQHLLEQTKTGNIQVIFTTHSPLVVEALTWQQVFIVRCHNGTTTVQDVPEALGADEVETVQGLVRAAPSAILAKRIIVGEGPTEVGFIKAILVLRNGQRLAAGIPTSVMTGTAVANGNGDSHAPVRAQAFADIGYETMLVLDADVDTNADKVAAAKAAGVEVVQWDKPHALEDAIFAVIPEGGILDLLKIVIDDRDVQSIADSLGGRLGVKLPADDVGAWAVIAGENYRAVLGATAKDKGWFKREDRGGKLGGIVWNYRSNLPPEGALRVGLRNMLKFAYGDEGWRPPRQHPCVAPRLHRITGRHRKNGTHRTTRRTRSSHRASDPHPHSHPCRGGRCAPPPPTIRGFPRNYDRPNHRQLEFRPHLQNARTRRHHRRRRT